MGRNKMLLVAVAILAVVAAGVGWFVVQQTREEAARDAYAEYVREWQTALAEKARQMPAYSAACEAYKKEHGKAVLSPEDYKAIDADPEIRAGTAAIDRHADRAKELRDRWESRWLALGLVGPGDL